MGVQHARTLHPHGGTLGKIAWSRDGTQIAAPTSIGILMVLDVPTGEISHQLVSRRGPLRVAAFNASGSIVASLSTDGVLQAWDLRTGTVLDELGLASTRRERPDHAYDLTFAPKQPVIAAVGPDNSARIIAVDADLKVTRELTGHTAEVTCLAFDPRGELVATGSADRSIRVWNADDGEQARLLLGHSAEVTAVAIQGAGIVASASADRTIKLWDLRAEGRLISTLEGHTESVSGLAFLADGTILASASRDGIVHLWDSDTGALFARFATQGRPRGATRLPSWPTLATDPLSPRLAAVASPDIASKHDDILLLTIDVERLRGAAHPTSITYTSAKIVLVGDAAVGKTTLGWRLAHGDFAQHPTTHGQQFWLLDQLAFVRADGAQCEAILWDLAGQPDYRLIHALFVDDADLALVLFDATGDDELRGASYWLSQLGISTARLEAEAPAPPVAILVASRSDLGDFLLHSDNILSYCAARGIFAFVATSALTGDGTERLIDLMRTAIAWDTRPTTVTTSTFRYIKQLVLTLKERSNAQQVILSLTELRSELDAAVSPTDPAVAKENSEPARVEFARRLFRRTARGEPLGRAPRPSIGEEELLSAVGHLSNHGYVTTLRTTQGDTRVLLAPELLNNLASSMVLEARKNTKGLGSLEESCLLSGEDRFSEVMALSVADREVLIDTAVRRFLERNIAFRQVDPLTLRVFLVFPQLIDLDKPPTPGEHMRDGPVYTATGAVENLYASLVVLLGYTGTFTHSDQWRHHARYVVGDGLVCGFRMESASDAEVAFTLYFAPGVDAHIQILFQGLFESLLVRPNLTVRRMADARCVKGHLLDRSAVLASRARGVAQLACPICGETGELKYLELPSPLTEEEATHLRRERRRVDDRARFEEAVFRLNAFVTQEERKTPTCFISYAWGDQSQERWVESLAEDLVKAGVEIVLDRWENARIGASVPRFVERITMSDQVIVVGTPLYTRKYVNSEPTRGFVAAAEGDLIGTRMIGTERAKGTVLPVLLSGSADDSLPPLLRGRVYADFRDSTQYFEQLLRVIFTLYDIAPDSAVGRELEESILGSDG